ncbi:reverse transcriptase domain-containing protein [Tanacetum coccineum]
MPPKKTPMTDAAIKELIAQAVADALADYEANRGSVNGHDSHHSGSGSGRTPSTARVCTYKDFLNYQPLNFKIKYATCTLLGNAPTWWNSHVKTVGHDAAYEMPWKTLMKMMTDKYCPRSEIKKLKIKIWNLNVKGTDVVSYTQCFQELELMCGRMFPEESDEVEKYVRELPDNIQGNVISARPKTMQEAIELANVLMDQKVRAYAERQAENKRKLDNNNQAQQKPPKKQNVARAYSARPSEKKEYVGTLPLCNKCKFHHNGPFIVKCANCKKVGHLTRDYRSPAATNNQRTLTCFECGNQRHYRSDCLE